MITAEGWDIPVLDLDCQATGIVTPVIKWATLKKGSPAGSIHFYETDYKFNRLWFNTSKLIAAMPSVCVECNFSTYATMPRAEALWNIYRKRTLARKWQDAGIAIIVDLNVEPCFRDLSLLGVPQGWNAYATRIHRGVPFSEIEADHAQAVERSGLADPFFVVFGGGQKIQVACRDRGWPWIPEHRQVVEGRYEPYGTGTQRSGCRVQGGQGVQGIEAGELVGHAPDLGGTAEPRREDHRVQL